MVVAGSGDKIDLQSVFLRPENTSLGIHFRLARCFVLTYIAIPDDEYLVNGFERIRFEGLM